MKDEEKGVVLDLGFGLEATRRIPLIQPVKIGCQQFQKIPIYCDNTSAINLSKNPVHHSRTKHIEVRHHFLKDHITKNDIKLEFISTKE